MLSDDKTRAEKIELVRARFESFAKQQENDRDRVRKIDRSAEREITRTHRREGPRLKR